MVKQITQGCEQDRAGCSVNRPTSPREITLFWARRDDIMTDGGEDVGTDGSKCYLTVAPNGLRQTNKHTCTHLTYIEEVDTTSSLKSGWPAPHQGLCFSLQNLWGLSGKQKTAIVLSKLRQTETNRDGVQLRRWVCTGCFCTIHCAWFIFNSWLDTTLLQGRTADLDSCLLQVAANSHRKCICAGFLLS